MINLKDSYLGKRVLITGGGGFIGSNLAIKLMELGADVSIMDSKFPQSGYKLFNLSAIYDKIYFDASDIRDKTSVVKNIKEKDIIFNLAAQVGDGPSEKNPQLDYEINILGHKNVLEACRDFNPSVRVFFPGSRTQYGKIEGDPLISEDHSMNPITPYAKNKVLGEKMYQEFYNSHGLETVMFRIANPYGPRAPINNPGYCITNWFIAKAMKDEEIPIYGDGNQLRDYIFIDDLVDAMVLIGVHKNAVGQIFNVGSGKGIMFKDMAQKIIDVSKSKLSKLKFIEWPQNAKDRETGDFIANISKIQSFTGWSPTHSLKEGLEKTFDFYRKNSDKYLL